MTLTSPIPASARTRMKRVQSKWSMYLRSPAAISVALLSLIQHLRDFRFRRWRIDLEVALEDVVNYGRRRAAAVAAVLDDAGCRDGRMILGRERDEPRVVLVLVGRVLVFFVALAATFVADDLRRAGFAAYDYVVEMRLVRGAAGAVDDVGHRVLHVLQRVGIDLHSVLDDRRIRLGDIAVESLDVLDELRLVADAAVGDLRGDLRHLQRRRRDVTLSNRDRQRFRGVPSL